MYRIEFIMYKDTVTERTDEDSLARKGRIIDEPFVLHKGVCMCAEYVKDADGNNLHGKMLQTSTVEKITENPKCLVVTTLNSTYVLEKL